MPAPEVTVVIPSRNRGALAARAVRTALAQEGVEVEVIVVDDGSEADRAPAAPDDPAGRVTVARRERAGGIAAARNTGIDRARATWVAFLDDDDLWAPGKLRAQLAAAAETEADLVYTGALVVDADGRVARRILAPAPGDVRERLAWHNAIEGGGSSVMMRTALARELRFDEQLSHLADWDMWLRVAAGHRLAHRPEPLIAYVQHPANMHVVDIASAIPEHERFVANAAVARGGGDVAAFWRWVGEAYLIGGRARLATRYYLRAIGAARTAGAVDEEVRHAIRALVLRRRDSRTPEDAPRWVTDQLASPAPAAAGSGGVPSP